MTRRRREKSSSSRSILIKPRSTIERDLFLEMAMPITEDMDVVLDSAMGRIELEVRGSPDVVNTVITKLSDLEHDIVAALYPDKNDHYYYNADILTQLCKPPVNLDLFAAALSVFGFETKVDEGGLLSEAPLEDLTSIHKQIVNLREPILGEFNRDIERFFIMIALTSNTDEIDLIIDTAIDLEVIKRNEYGYQLTVELDEAKDKVLEQLGIELKEAMHLEEEQELRDINFNDLGFDGGKIVFMKDGKEVEDPEFES